MDAIKGEMDDTLTRSVLFHFWLGCDLHLHPSRFLEKEKRVFILSEERGDAFVYGVDNFIYVPSCSRQSRHDIISTTKCTRKVPTLQPGMPSLICVADDSVLSVWQQNITDNFINLNLWTLIRCRMVVNYQEWERREMAAYLMRSFVRRKA